MSTTFAKDEMIQANKFRVLSQKALRQEIEQHEKLGVLFSNNGLEAVMLSYERYEAIVKRLNELEEALEDMKLETLFVKRLETPENKWISHPEGVSTLELYRQRQREQ